MKKITIIYSGHQIDYLYGLLSGFKNQNSIKIDVIDALRDDIKIPSSNKIKVYEFLDWRGIIKTRYYLFFISWFKYYYRLFNYIRYTDSEVIHIEWINKYFSIFEEIFLTILYKKYNKKIIFKVHDIDSNVLLNSKGKFNLKISFSKKFFYKRIDGFIAHNNFVKKILVSYGIDKEKISVIPHGINNYVKYENYSKVESKSFLNLPQNAKVVLFFGNISPYKNLESILKLFSDIDLGDNVYLVVAGKFRRGLKQYRQKIMSLINKSKNKNRILFHDHFINNEDIEKYFAASDLLCLPYKFIFQSGVLFLSYAMGLPVLAKKVGGISEDIKEGVTGYTYEKDEELESKLQLMLNDNKLKRGKELRDFCENHYCWNNIINDTIKVYSKNKKQIN